MRTSTCPGSSARSAAIDVHVCMCPSPKRNKNGTGCSASTAASTTPFCHARCDRHSALAGSRDLEDWGRAALEASAGAYRERVVGPLLQLKNELFQTFRCWAGCCEVGLHLGLCLGFALNPTFPNASPSLST